MDTMSQPPPPTERTLVIILGQTRAWEVTYESIKKNVLDALGADLCLCIGAEASYDKSNPFYQAAKYHFLYDEPDDWGAAFDEAQRDILGNDAPVPADASVPEPFVRINNRNPVYGRLSDFSSSTDDIKYLGRFPSIDHITDDIKEPYESHGGFSRF